MRDDHIHTAVISRYPLSQYMQRQNRVVVPTTSTVSGRSGNPTRFDQRRVKSNGAPLVVKALAFSSSSHTGSNHAEPSVSISWVIVSHRPRNPSLDLESL